MANSYLSQSVGLEWRFSFSQAEMILSDHIPPPARSSYLAFKAVVKDHINRKLDFFSYQYHAIPSYVLKTILFKEVETKPKTYWAGGTIIEDFLELLFAKLVDCIVAKSCSNYWLPKLNLLKDITDADKDFFLSKLGIIRMDLRSFVGDNWLECQRCIRLRCCASCYKPPKFKHAIEAQPDKCGCCDVAYQYSDESCCCGPMTYDNEYFDVY